MLSITGIVFTPFLLLGFIFAFGKEWYDGYAGRGVVEINDIGSQVADVLHHDLEYEHLYSTSWYGRHGQQLSGGVNLAPGSGGSGGSGGGGGRSARSETSGGRATKTSTAGVPGSSTFKMFCHAASSMISTFRGPPSAGSSTVLLRKASPARTWALGRA